MDNVCNRCLFSIPSKVEMAEEQEYLRCDPLFQVWPTIPSIVTHFYKSNPFFPGLTHFYKCDQFYQLWSNFLSVTHFSKCD